MPKMSKKQKRKSKRAVKAAVNEAGGKQQVALHFDVTPEAVGNWMRRGCPINRARGLHKLSGGEVGLGDLRPDLFPIE